MRSGLQAWPRPKAEAASQSVEDGRRTWLRVPDGLLVRVPDGLLVRVRRTLLLIYWDFQHIAKTSLGGSQRAVPDIESIQRVVHVWGKMLC